MVKPTLHYFPIRGRGEPIRLVLASQCVDFNDATVNFAAMKQDLVTFPCGQCPRYEDEDVAMVQSNAILRHLGRKHGMYGATLKEQAQVDMILDSVEGQKSKYLPLIYEKELADEAKAAYWSTHCDEASIHGRNSGCHFYYLTKMVSGNNAPFALGAQLSVADIAVADLVDMHIRIYGEQFKEAFPALTAHHVAVFATPGIAEYVASDKRPTQQNGKPLG